MGRQKTGIFFHYQNGSRLSDFPAALEGILEKNNVIYYDELYEENPVSMFGIPVLSLPILTKTHSQEMIDAVKASEAEFRTYRRNQPERLERYLADSRYNNRFIVTESIFSMDGDTANLAELVDIVQPCLQ